MKFFQRLLKLSSGPAVAIVIGIIIFGFVIYGSYWIAKNVSYSIFYEDMVQQTIVEMVKPDSLR